jgi:hypothetical protein
MKNILALLADWANGIFAVLLAAAIVGIDPLWWHFIVGIVLAMSPDIDAIPELLMRGRVSASAAHTRDHRTFLHYPIISLPLGFLAAYTFGYWGLVWCISLCLHLLNDLYGTGWGLALFYPLSTRHYKFFTRRVNQSSKMLKAAMIWHNLPAQERKLRLLVSWSKAELPSYIVRYGIDNWIRQCYLTINPISITEYSLFALALSLVFVNLV